MQTLSLPGFYEPFNAISHLLGAVTFGGLAFPLLLRSRGDTRRVLLFSVFATACTALLALSGVYHMLPEGRTARHVLGRLDQAAIFLVIVGTHTPVQGLYFRGVARWGVITCMWLLAICGITLFSVYYHSLPEGLGTAIYLLLGWIAGVAGLVVWIRHGGTRIKLLLLGGVVYSLGALLLGLGWPTLIPGVLGSHELWHMAVLIAMGLHWRFMFANASRELDGPVQEAA